MVRAQCKPVVEVHACDIKYVQKHRAPHNFSPAAQAKPGGFLPHDGLVVQRAAEPFQDCSCDNDLRSVSHGHSLQLNGFGLPQSWVLFTPLNQGSTCSQVLRCLE